MLPRIGLVANVAKSKIIMCHTEMIRSEMPEEAFGLHSTGEGETYWELLTGKLPFLDCRVEITAVYITAHRQQLHRTKP